MLKCGCRVNVAEDWLTAIIYCPLHANAGRMAKCLDRIVNGVTLGEEKEGKEEARAILKDIGD